MQTLEKLLSSSSYPKKTILEKLICHYCSLEKKELFTELEYKISAENLEKIKEGYRLYTVEKKPLEYIIEHVTFTGISFKVSPKTLIPRPETEYMIEAVNEYISDLGSNDVHVIDVWTGCGVLWLAVYQHNQEAISKVLLTELDPETLDVAKQNAKSLCSPDAPIHFLEASLLDHKEVNKFLDYSPLVLVSNLPYIPEELFDNNTDEGVRKREPKMAFVWGEDGCDLYRVMFDQLLERKREREKGRNSDDVTDSSFVMFLEMMTWQVDVLRKEYPQFEIEEVKTFHFNIRILKGRFKVESKK